MIGVKTQKKINLLNKTPLIKTHSNQSEMKSLEHILELKP